MPKGNPAPQGHKFRALQYTLDIPTCDRFVREYLKDFSAEHAYVRTFPGRENSAKIMAVRLITRNAYIRSEIARLSEGRITLADVTKERVTLEIARLALSDLRKTVRTEVTAEGMSEVPIPLAMIDDDTAASIKEVSYDDRGNRKIKTHSKENALAMLATITGAVPLSRGVGHNPAGAITHDATADEEIMRLLAEHEDPGNEIDATDDDFDEDDTIDIDDE